MLSPNAASTLVALCGPLVQSVFDPVSRTKLRKKAKTFERKKQCSRRVLLLEISSPLNNFFTGGVEYDGRLHWGRLETFIEDFDLFIDSLHVSPAWGEGVELKFRRLGHHRADGLYYPDQAILVLDLKSSRSFAHEFAHLVDYRASHGRQKPNGAGAFSSSDAFRPFHELLVTQMDRRGKDDARLKGKSGRLSWSYFTSPAECFARAFEQFVSELLPAPSSLVGEAAKFRQDPFFFEDVPGPLAEYFSALLAAPRGTP